MKTSTAFAELWQYQFEQVLNFLNKFGMELDNGYMDSLDRKLSQIVFDKKDNIRSLLLCRTVDEETLVELLIGATKASEFILVGLQGFMRAVEQEGEKDMRIAMLTATDNVVPLMKRLLDKRFSYKTLGEVHSTSGDCSSEFTDMIKAAEESCLYQRNIQWKCPWAGQHRGETA